MQRVIDSQFFGWTVYEMQESEIDEKKCFMVMSPTKSDSDNYSRKNPYVMITRYQNKRVEEFAISMDFEFRIGSKAFIAIDDVTFNLQTHKDKAFARNSYDDAAIIQYMLDSSVLKARADSASGSYAVDEYNLQGIARAYTRLKYICK